MIYLNCAATSYTRPECVIQAVASALSGMGSSGRGASKSELASARIIFDARENMAQLLGFSHPERVCFTANATEALNIAIMGLVGPGDHVVVTDWDHNSMLRPLHRLVDEADVRLDYVRADKQGILIIEDFERLIDEHTRLVCVTHQSNLTGNICDLERIAQIVHDKGAYLLVDAAQSAGAMSIDMDKLGIDVLCFTGHKALMGPQGTGGIAVAPHVDIASTIEGGTGVLSFERRQPAVYPEHLEAGTLNTHGLAGLAASTAWILDTGIDTVREHDIALTKQFLKELSDIEGIELYGDFNEPHGPIVSLNMDGITSSALADKLSFDFDIATRAGAHCAPRMHRALGTQDTGAVRFSWNWFTTSEDIHHAAQALRTISKQ